MQTNFRDIWHRPANTVPDFQLGPITFLDIHDRILWSNCFVGRKHEPNNRPRRNIKPNQCLDTNGVLLDCYWQEHPFFGAGDGLHREKVWFVFILRSTGKSFQVKTNLVGLKLFITRLELIIIEDTLTLGDFGGVYCKIFSWFDPTKYYWISVFKFRF